MKNTYSLIIALAVTACGSNGSAPTAAASGSDVAAVPFGRLDASVSLDANAQALSQDYDAGGIAMYKVLAATTPSNMIFSSYALQTAMGMMYAGAQGSTASNMAQTLHWSLSPADLPPAHAQLTTVIATDANRDAIELQTGTRIWVDKALGLQADYAAGLSQNYEASAVVEPLSSDAEGSRTIINQWASQQTHGLIPELLPAHALDGDALLVQTAALYFKAPWSATFTRDAAANTPFTHPDASQSSVAMIRTTDDFLYADANDYTAIDMPYGQGFSTALLIVMPKGSLADFEQSLDGNFVHRALAGLTSTYVQLAVPVLDLQQTPDMTAALTSMGLTDAMTDSADFAGIGSQPVKISQIYEQAVLKLDEHGTEAAAAAAVVGVTTTSARIPPTPTPFIADHAFFFCLHDIHSGTPLFTGRVVAP